MRHWPICADIEAYARLWVFVEKVALEGHQAPPNLVLYEHPSIVDVALSSELEIRV